MDGFLVIDKPAGITSHDVVARVRWILKTKRVGHTGTLDPFATGALVVLIGKATRLAQFVDKDEKSYEAVVKFGYETDTGDRTGIKKNDSAFDDADIPEILRTANWNVVLQPFRGEIRQLPPMYSAKKVEGKKLYELARQGVEIERDHVQVAITQLEIGAPGERPDEVNFSVTCSAGTYIRTLAEDIGRALGTGAHLNELRRTRAGKFGLGRAVTLDRLEDLKARESVLSPMEELVSHLDRMDIDADRSAKTRHGLSTRIVDRNFNDGDPIAIFEDGGGLIAVGYFVAVASCVQPKIVLI